MSARDRDRDREKDRERERRRDRDRDRDSSRSSRSSRDKYRDRRDRDSKDKDKDRKKTSSSSSSSSSSRRDRDRDRDKSRSKSSSRSEKKEDGDGDVVMKDGDGFKVPKANGVNGASSHKKSGEKRKISVQLGELSAMAKKAKKAHDASNNQKPVFLTKKQRQELALKELAEKRKAERQKQEAQRKAYHDLERKARDSEMESRRSGSRGGGLDGPRSRFMSDRDRERERAERAKSREERNRDREQKKKAEAQEKITQDIKASYLGQKKRKKRIIPPSQKFRFSFDWPDDDDTARDLHPLYQKKADLSMQFGRGFVAGVDREEQKKKQTVYDKLVKQHKIADVDLRKEIERKQKERATKQKEADRQKRKQNRHWKDKTLSEMTARDWRIFREDYNISTRGSNLPLPLRSWRESSLPKEILKVLDDIGYRHPTPVQRMAVPIGLSNRDVVGIAETGSGKTCAFLLPMLVYIQKQPKMTEDVAANGPYAIVLAPSRELAQQIEEECTKFSKRLGIRTAPIVGGVSIEAQSFQLREGAEIVIATPGRLMDCIERRYLVLNQCNYLVLDEADRMMEMGFQDQVNGILEKMPSSNMRPENPEDAVEDQQYRQTFMFSATMPQQVEFITKKFLRNPAYIAIGERSGKTADRVKQRVVFAASQAAKRRETRSLLDKSDPPIMIFCNQKSECDNLSRFLNDAGYNTDVLHGGKQQDVRERALQALKDAAIDVLVCTNVAGRGIHIDGVTHVINYDMPTTIEEYTHRIGRTGRAGREGEATSLLTPQDEGIMYDLKNLLVATNNPVPSELARNPASQQKPGTGRPKPKVVFAKK